MAKWKGKNNNDTVREQMVYRARYATRVFKNHGKRPESVKNFNFSEMVQYGRVDADGNPVVVIRDKLALASPSAKKGELKFTLPFVGKMFDSLKNKFNQAALMGHLSIDDPYLSSLQIHYAYDDPVLLYQNFTAEMIQTFNEEYLTIRKNGIDVMTLDDYSRHLIRFVKILGRDFPITLTGFQKSKNSNIFTSGITISIADLDCSKDELKEIFFADNPCINFYLNAAKQYGFSVMKNAPWILVADLDSVSTKIYTNDTSPRDIFHQNYIKTYNLDLEFLPRIIQKPYNSFVSNYQYKKEFNICNNTTNVNNIYRQYITNKQFDKKYNIEYWIPLYIEIRNLEEGSPYNEPEIFRMVQKAFSFQKLLDNENALGYINEQYRIKHKFADGGYLYYKKRFDARKLEDK